MHRRFGIAANAYPLFSGALEHEIAKLLLPHERNGVIAVFLVIQPAMLFQAIHVEAQQNWNGATARRPICTVRTRCMQKTFVVFKRHACVRPEGVRHGDIPRYRHNTADESPALCKATTAVTSATDI